MRVAPSRQLIVGPQRRRSVSRFRLIHERLFTFGIRYPGSFTQCRQQHFLFEGHVYGRCIDELWFAGNRRSDTLCNDSGIYGTTLWFAGNRRSDTLAT